ncbi:d-ribose pyranase [Candidatus Arthromitus sp. SFB-mouse-Japan]|uniref:D-ribose pyranase n=1 Tax=unclassified Candidatus Neoarthromitus TaxID=2638829 RepID=UPI00021B809C|nr:MULTISPECIES: D-ribose pyranase [unclassified Candidatus Arthromitus]EIA21826.1 D-ribose pyranase [Candidatus Arthromitus sp. SFB-2]EIA22086.1 D-ribose pyranase [Candidatus Arthromitus sp. SFB-1]EIA26063.1 D-ribose pyranase [Candidatus Arthromitus sp. SFB-3]EIA26375.1 D-ribose pyranase [Candidatus Arthromitus sp. SFB-4]EIA26752.1 D-ribose pyranase [Candidatus Arthromitus sp. SFB-5]EIA28596.1 D-ribose pyranase [Candidatus Arthromitus sp. SFB-co]EIA30739.1 D-ribose pyranase [Candidatus Arth
MKKTCLLNNSISSVISKMGHTDMIAIGDCGLPIPKETKRIDLALTKGIPSFLDTLKTTLTELEIEEIIIAKETEETSPKIFNEIKNLIGNAKITFVSHEIFKTNLKECKAVIRTGEQTPYANIILKSGVVF